MYKYGGGGAILFGQTGFHPAFAGMAIVMCFSICCNLIQLVLNKTQFQSSDLLLSLPANELSHWVNPDCINKPFRSMLI